MIRALTRFIFYCAITAFVGLFIWSYMTARTWQEVAEQAQGVATQTLRNADACFDQLRQVNAEVEKEADKKTATAKAK